MVVVDTLCASVGEAMLREAKPPACSRRALSIDELAAWVEENRLKICYWFTVDTFEHLRHGGAFPLLRRLSVRCWRKSSRAPCGRG